MSVRLGMEWVQLGGVGHCGPFIQQIFCFFQTRDTGKG